MSTERPDIDALVATIAGAASTVVADRSIVPRVDSGDARERIEALLAVASAISLLDSIGEGGRGVVLAAEQLGLGREVAVKKVRGEQTDEAVIELLQEAVITGRLEHPNIVPVHYIGVGDDGEPFIVLKKIDGTGWDKLIATRDLEFNLGIFLDVVDAVRFAHSRGIIHRDLKPANVMVGEFGEVYVLDWGLAVSLEAEPGWLPRAADVSDIAGTLAYMAPEMLAASGLSERTDVYLLGAILCEIATGRPPHRGAVLDKLVESVVRSRPPLDGVPGELAAIIERAMRPDPRDRFASADELKQAIESFLVHREAARLADGASKRLAALLEAAAAGADRDALYNLFGECRFGFREAMRRWPEGQQARDGLARAVAAMVEHELERGEAVAAERLLAEVDAVPATLQQRVDDAVAAQRGKLEALERLEADLDPRVAGGWRSVGAAALGLTAAAAFALAPVFSPSAGAPPSWPALLVVLVAAGAVIGAGAVLMRRPLFSSRPNRIFGLAVAISWVSSMAALAGMWLGGVDSGIYQPLQSIVWFCCAAMLVGTVDRWLWPGAAILLGAIVVMPSLGPIASRVVLVACLMALIVNVVWVSLRRLRD